MTHYFDYQTSHDDSIQLSVTHQDLIDAAELYFIPLVERVGLSEAMEIVSGQFIDEAELNLAWTVFEDNSYMLNRLIQSDTVIGLAEIMAIKEYKDGEEK
jgi:hypothetical protein